MANQVGNALASRGVGVEDRVLIGLSTASSSPPRSSASSRSARWSPWSTPSCPTATTSTTSATRARARSSPTLALTDRIAPLHRALEAACAAVITVGPARPAASAGARRSARASPELRRTTTRRRTIRRCGCSPPARRASRRARSTCTTTSPSTPSATPSRCSACARDDVTLGVPKLFFGYATGTNLMFPFAVGATTVLFQRARDARAALRRSIARHRADGAHQRADDDQQDGAGAPARPRALAPLRVVHLRRRGAAPRSSTAAGRRRFGVEILDGIGSAELFHIYISNRFGEVKPGSLGTPGARLRSAGRRRRRRRRPRRRDWHAVGQGRLGGASATGRRTRSRRRCCAATGWSRAICSAATPTNTVPTKQGCT